MKQITIKSLLFAVCGVLFALNGNAASSIFSNYGQIQNVQTYSSNPFWNPNSPYNSSMPRPVYAQGTDLKTEDCTSVVQSLVAVQCMVRDNCRNTKLAEIRPEIMVQLSKLPNHNYVTACAGFIDGIYEQYVEYYGNSVPTNRVAFPNATVPNQNLNGDTIQIENPYKQQPPEWKTEIKQRANELEYLQNQNGGNSAHLTATAFPTTYADVSFADRIANEATGLEPYKDLKAYKELNVKTASEWCNDGDHENSPECRKFLCSATGPKASESYCITWRCSDKDYANKHDDECQWNKYCGDSTTSQRCLEYRCRLDGDKDLAICRKWLCENDPAHYENDKEYCDNYLHPVANNSTNGNSNSGGDNGNGGTEHQEDDVIVFSI